MADRRRFIIRLYPGTEYEEVILAWDDGKRTRYKTGCTCDCCSESRGACPGLDDIVRTWLQEQRAKAPLALERSRQLLVSLLNEEQRRQFEEEERFKLLSQLGKIYIISTGYSGNVWNPTIDRRYCCYLKDSVPVYDHMIGQLLALKYNEELFLETAY